MDSPPLDAQLILVELSVTGFDPALVDPLANGNVSRKPTLCYTALAAYD